MVLTCRSPALGGRLLAFALIGLTGLVSGCGKKPAAPPAQPAVAPAPAKPAIPLPPRTPGLWEMTLTEEGSEDSPQILQICIDAATDLHLGILGTDLSGDRCRKTVSKVDTGWGVLAACDMGNNVSNEYSGSITGDYTTDYTMKLRSQTTNPQSPQGNRVTNYAVAAKRLSACEADQQPGDVINDGVKFNLFDMAGLRPRSSANTTASAAPGNPDDVVD